MKKTLLSTLPKDIPERILPLLLGAPVWDSSCSPEARVLFIEREGGIYLKSAAAGTLLREAEMTRFFHSRGMGTEVLDYFTEGGKDWLLTAAVAPQMPKPERAMMSAPTTKGCAKKMFAI